MEMILWTAFVALQDGECENESLGLIYKSANHFLIFEVDFLKRMKASQLDNLFNTHRARVKDNHGLQC
ncbi:hypothetical protein L1987_79707 [Smallanthus sonchifolius]|uniref:Uncharacterized protein n=1 Tax=Smallanthus sonchifolius TaxID=185202 RepID=A0ACB8YKU5_9ASTR|nr:hypothetical protein L1987_79707 [Smallanthus sonchifolius]